MWHGHWSVRDVRASSVLELVGLGEVGVVQQRVELAGALVAPARGQQADRRSVERIGGQQRVLGRRELVVEVLGHDERLEHRAAVVVDRRHGAEGVDLGGVPRRLLGAELDVDVVELVAVAQLLDGPPGSVRGTDVSGWRGRASAWQRQGGCLMCCAVRTGGRKGRACYRSTGGPR